ncbi:MAG: hypothetical protein ACI8YD_003698, partial [Rheinheimera aquimaris]
LPCLHSTFAMLITGSLLQIAAILPAPANLYDENVFWLVFFLKTPCHPLQSNTSYVKTVGSQLYSCLDG